MTYTPLVSFIIYVCDTDSDKLRKCIESILSLSLGAHEREIIVADDGSDVYTLQGLAEYADRILYLRKCREGTSSTRNMALRMATGRFVQFMDGDGLLLRAPYEHCLDIVRYHNPDVVIFKRTANAAKGRTPFAYTGPMTGSEFMLNNTLRTAETGYIFERSALGNLRFNADVMVGDDEFMPRLFLRSERFYTTDSYAYLCAGLGARGGMSSAWCDDMERIFADTERTLVRLHTMVVPEVDRLALNRRTAQLTVDYLCDIIRCTHDAGRLNAAIDRLADRGLYPLPDRDYSKRYRYFRKMIGNRITRRLLFVLIK